MLPWEAPITELYVQGIIRGVREDGCDSDQLAVGALPAQEAILEAFGQLGSGSKSAVLEADTEGRVVLPR